MRDYGKVHTSFWTSESIRPLSEDAKFMVLYLLTSPHGTISGVFRLPYGYMCDDLNWIPERVKTTVAELLKNGFCNRCETTCWMWIIEHFKWNKPENPNQKKSARKIVESIPDKCAWKHDFMRLNAEFLGIKYEHLSNPFETVSKPVTVTGAVIEAVTVPETAAVIVIAEKNATTAKDTELQSACRETWKAYSDAYFDRYGVEPVRNAKVNANVKQLVQRLGHVESPHVAAFFVGSNNSYYTSRMHAVDCIVKDAEKLRTEWATGNRVTQSKAKQLDNSQNNLDSVGEALRILEASNGTTG
jgi:hypothetical protein